MKLNKLFIALSVASMAFASCENALVQDVELDIAIETNDNVQFDGKTITVKQGTPIPFKVGGDPDFLTFFSGEAGKEYRYKDRVTVEEDLIESSRLQFSIVTQYGKPENILQVLISDNFPGLATNDFKSDSVLVEAHEWQTLIPQSELPKASGTLSYDVDMTPYLGKRIAIALCYKPFDITQTQSRFQFNDMAIMNTLKSGVETNLTAESFGFTALNMYYAHPDVLDATGISGNRRTYIGGKPYGTNTSTSNVSGLWNLNNLSAFFIHSSNANTPLIYTWLVSNLIVANACTPDSGTAIKSMHQRLNAYNYTYNTPGTYTATFVATNGNYKQETSVVKEYTVVVTE